MDRPDAGPARGAGRASSASRPSRPTTRASNLHRVTAAALTPLHAARSRGSTRLVLRCDVGQAQRAARPDGAARCRSRRPGRRRSAAELGRPDRSRPGCAATSRTTARPHAARARDRGGLGGRAARTCRCCTSSSTSTPAGELRRCCSTPRAAPSRTASSAARSGSRCGWPRSSATERRAARRAGAADRARRRRRRPCDGRRQPTRARPRRAIVAIPPTLAGADRLRPAAARPSATSSPSGCRRAR